MRKSNIKLIPEGRLNCIYSRTGRLLVVIIVCSLALFFVIQTRLKFEVHYILKYLTILSSFIVAETLFIILYSISV